MPLLLVDIIGYIIQASTSVANFDRQPTRVDCLPGIREESTMVQSLAVVCLICMPATAAGLPDSQDNPSEKHQSIQGSIDDVAWLTGSWTGRQGRSETEEHWIEPNGGMMLAVNRTVQGDKGFFEYLRIQEKNDSISYFASPAGRTAVEFRLKELGDRRVVFENLNNDFPQRIIYERKNQELQVKIEGDADGQLRSTNWTWKKSATGF